MDERPKLPHYDPDYCLKVAKWAASICVVILVAELLTPLFVEPSSGQCPGWNIYAENGSATPSWILAGIFTGGPAIWICYVVLHWEQKFSRKLYDAIAYKQTGSVFQNLVVLNAVFGSRPKPNPQELKPDTQELDYESILFTDANRAWLLGCATLCLFCTFPLLLMLAKCTGAPRYLGY